MLLDLVPLHCQPIAFKTSTRTIGLPAIVPVRQLAGGSTCWAAAIASVRATRGETTLVGERELAEAFWAGVSRFCPDEASTYQGNWDAGVYDLGCAMRFGGVYVGSLDSGAGMTLASLVAALGARHIVLSIQIPDQSQHVVLVWAGTEETKDNWKFCVTDPKFLMDGTGVLAPDLTGLAAFEAA